MGGLGSGSWYRWDAKDTVEQCHRVDIRYLKRQSLLKPGYLGWLKWSRGDEETGSIRYRIEENRMVLLYRHRAHGGEWEEVEEPVYFDWTPCNYGGERRWFICPIMGCGKRVAVLYGRVSISPVGIAMISLMKASERIPMGVPYDASTRSLNG